MGILLFSCNALFSIKNQYFSRRVFWWNGAQHIFSYFFFQKKKRSKKSFFRITFETHILLFFFWIFLKNGMALFSFFLQFFFPTRKKQQITLCVVRLCVNLRASFFLVLLCGGGYLSFNVQIKCVRHKRVDVVVSSCSM